MASVVDICNQSISHLGISNEIADYDLESSKEAQACRRFYEQARDEVLRAFAWPFATKTASLGGVVDDPTTEWQYGYTYPADAVRVHRIHNGSAIRVEDEGTRVEFGVSYGASGNLLYTDQRDAVIEYTYRETNTERFPADFVNALSYLLASKIGPRVAGGDQFGLSDRAYALYVRSLDTAIVNALNETRHDLQPDAEMVRVRG